MYVWLFRFFVFYPPPLHAAMWSADAIYGGPAHICAAYMHFYGARRPPPALGRIFLRLLGEFCTVPIAAGHRVYGAIYGARPLWAPYRIPQGAVKMHIGCTYMGGATVNCICRPHCSMQGRRIQKEQNKQTKRNSHTYMHIHK
jgi:hypothetical protein